MQQQNTDYSNQNSPKESNGIRQPQYNSNYNNQNSNTSNNPSQNTLNNDKPQTPTNPTPTLKLEDEETTTNTAHTSTKTAMQKLFDDIDKEREIQLTLKAVLEEKFGSYLDTSIKYVVGEAPTLTSKLLNTNLELAFDVSEYHEDEEDGEITLSIYPIDEPQNIGIKFFNEIPKLLQYLYYAVPKISNEYQK